MKRVQTLVLLLHTFGSVGLVSSSVKMPDSHMGRRTSVDGREIIHKNG